MNKWASTTLIQYMHVQDVGICVPVHICASYRSVCTVVAASRFLADICLLQTLLAPRCQLCAFCVFFLYFVFLSYHVAWVGLRVPLLWLFTVTQLGMIEASLCPPLTHLASS